MAGRSIGMRKTREIIRLSVGGMGDRAVARSCGVSPSTVGTVVRSAKAADLYCWPLPALSNSELKERLAGPATPGRGRPLPEFERIDTELRRKHMTLQLLWEDYRTAYPGGYEYSRFCELYRAWRRGPGAEPVMRFEHKAGETLFVDWAGSTVAYRENGADFSAAIFVGVLGASDYIYAGAYRDMALDNWLQAHVDAFDYIGGVPARLVPDNPRTGVSRACRYDPELNPAYAELAAYYSVTVLPARPARPRDKAKAENGVRLVGQQVIARLRRMQFLSFGQVRAAVADLREEINRRPFSKREGSRRSLFDEIERGELKPLPARPFSRGRWVRATVFKDYHIELGGFYYSVPYRHIGASVDVRICGNDLEIYLDGLRIAAHPCPPAGGARASTLAEHMPPDHRAFMSQTVEDYLEKASRCGPRCRELMEAMLRSYPRPEMGFRGCQGILRLAQRYGRERLESACARSLDAGSARYRTVRNLLENRLEQVESLPDPEPIRHGNVRGSGYYAGTGGRQ